MHDAAASSWWGRNWRWFLPVGCLTCVLLCCGGVAAIVGGVFSMIKSSDAYQMAVAAARNDPEAQQALGTPIEEGFFTTGNIHIQNDSGNAQLAIPLSGPKGSGTLHVEAVRAAGRWKLSTLVLEKDDTGQRIDLL